MRPELTTEWVAEDDLATQLNVSREVLLAAREKMAAEDVDKDGPWVVWRKTAATAFAAAAGMTWPADEKSAPSDELVTVASTPRAGGWHFPNPRIVKARRGNGELVDVVVMNSSKYTTHLRTGEPMTFRARKSSSGSHWTLVGREPRYRGGW